MKKPLIFLLAVCCSVPAVAQDWKEALRNAASNIVDKATGGKATEALMVGDRYEKDGLAASGNGVDYLIVGKTKKDRASIC